jgi:hypothetical protein
MDSEDAKLKHPESSKPLPSRPSWAACCFCGSIGILGAPSEERAACGIGFRGGHVTPSGVL